jgi:hypothetical protein
MLLNEKGFCFKELLQNGKTGPRQENRSLENYAKFMNRS